MSGAAGSDGETPAGADGSAPRAPDGWAPAEAVPDVWVVSAGEVRTARLLVAAQFVLLGLIAVLPGGWGWPVPAWLRWSALAGVVAGLVVMLLAGTALGRGLTAVPIPNRHAVLRTGGLYRVVRHPIYTGLLLAAGSWTVGSGSGWRALAFVALVVLLSVKARWEEERLARRFAAYPDYASRTPRFVPGWRVR
ncbi:isoprenylcysteine carboxylmethyltransferase family protein [Isoptericola sp. b441]|uniref:Isoprenylcysteine carboxylmethyltransferase family protein n=1 Tax=Actinotalea lenta TaxID=3064654 RepID=A0ABT9D6A7_9CELL|nr:MULTISPECIES: isoprenylcysteine carboxylmethyltransferase family protein [unclassified Isoptericola]MDO8106353.1 isoprenylcysteine carboxylmethyltransferase family protein [Isoptericola sp. b441]MDO8121928.1 isoprenylcysteine carboxylmethyltransferase family protein [Isoptericola sp. b490]